MHQEFERFGIKNLSPSSINAFRHNPSQWAVQYLMGIREPGNASMFRGDAVKFGVWNSFDKSAEIAYSEALRSFDTSCGGAGLDPEDETVTKEREMVSQMLTQALTIYMGDKSPRAHRLRVEDWIDEVGMPVVGYIDFVFDGTVDDLKTIKAMPSKPSLRHLRKLSIYRRARKETPRIAYVTAKKAAIFAPEAQELHSAWDGMVRDAMAIGNLLSRAETPLDVVRMLPVDESDYAWGEGQLQAALSLQTFIAPAKSEKPDAPLLAAQ